MIPRTKKKKEKIKKKKEKKLSMVGMLEISAEVETG